MSLRIIYTLERFLSASVGVWVSKNLSKDTRDTCCTLNRLCKRKVKFGKCNVCVINLAID